MEKLKQILTACLFLILPLCGCADSEAEEVRQRYASLPDGLYAVIVTDKGDIVLQLYFEETPMTVANFVGLAEGTIRTTYREGKPFYDGLTFHRVVDGFVIQGGDPKGNGTGGPGYKFRDEFVYGLKHDSEGVLSMANSGPNTNGSQFFITLSATPHLDYVHTVFGKVVEGMDVVRQIRQGDEMKRVIIVRNGEKASAFIVDDDVFSEHRSTLPQRQQAFEKKMNETVLAQVGKDFGKAIEAANGIRYIVEKNGDGPRPQTGNTVTVHYTGRLTNGQIFDSSVGRAPFAFQVGTGQVIKGWDQMVGEMRKGEKRKVLLPPETAYGSRGAGPIPPNSWLVFEIEVLDISE